MTEAEQTEALSRIELGDLWGVAGRMVVRLAAIGIRTPLELRDADPKFVRSHSSVVMERTVLELRGVSCLALEDAPPDRKMVLASRSFGHPVTDRYQMEEAVTSHVARAAEKARRENLAAGCRGGLAGTDRLDMALPAGPR